MKVLQRHDKTTLWFKVFIEINFIVVFLKQYLESLREAALLKHMMAESFDKSSYERCLMKL